MISFQAFNLIRTNNLCIKNMKFLNTRQFRKLLYMATLHASGDQTVLRFHDRARYIHHLPANLSSITHNKAPLILLISMPINKRRSSAPGHMVPGNPFYERLLSQYQRGEFSGEETEDSIR